jgi:hypothetical protein
MSHIDSGTISNCPKGLPALATLKANPRRFSNQGETVADTLTGVESAMPTATRTPYER